MKENEGGGGDKKGRGQLTWYLRYFLIFLKFFFENFFVKNWRIFFFLIFFSLLLISFHIKNSKNMYLIYRKKYPHFNMHFLPFQNSLFSQCKKRKIEKIEFFCAYCVHTQNFLRDNSLMLCCSPKNFPWFFETFLVLKFLAKKFFSRKKGWTTEISEKKKKVKNGRFSPIGRNMGPIFWGSICGY